MRLATEAPLVLDPKVEDEALTGNPNIKPNGTLLQKICHFGGCLTRVVRT